MKYSFTIEVCRLNLIMSNHHALQKKTHDDRVQAIAINKRKHFRKEAVQSSLSSSARYYCKVSGYE